MRNSAEVRRYERMRRCVLKIAEGFDEFEKLRGRKAKPLHPSKAHELIETIGQICGRDYKRMLTTIELIWLGTAVCYSKERFHEDLQRQTKTSDIR